MAALCCQKCRTPLKVDSSLQDLNPASFKILADAAPELEPRAPDVSRSAAARQRREHYDKVAHDAGSPSHRGDGSGSGSKPRLDPGMSYINITESLVAPEGPGEVISTPTKAKGNQKKPIAINSGDDSEAYSQQMEATVRLFEILSARSDIDHPICSECTDILLDELQKRQASVLKERDAYVGFLKRAQQGVPTEDEKAKTKRDLEEARRREKIALQELEALEAEKARMEDEIAALDVESEALDEKEERFWQERNAFTQELTAFQEERDSLQNQLAHDTKLLEALQRTNVYNDTFCIGHDGVFGTINGLRLGRLADHPVEWAEINAAIGQAVLLLVIVAEKLNCRLRGYRLVPVGSTSKIVLDDPRNGVPADHSKSKGTSFELHSTGSVAFGLGLGGFDAGMERLLECLRQVGEHVGRASSPTSGSPVKTMPYKIEKDRIGDVSIKLGGVSKEEQWTKACKYALTCCKFLLAHASHAAHEADAKLGR